ncbi:MAG: PIG-L deacetylase family protein [Pelolinea sp.]|nr:PIG-L deacetylase family protein [Pelolinea sp.]
MNTNLLLKAKKVLFIGAHPDDIELGCGALISNLSPSAEITCVTLSDNQKNPMLGNVVTEQYASMALLGVNKNNVIFGSFETRRFMHQRQEILEFLIIMKKEHLPDVVFVHSQADLHQDHNTVTQEALRAFRGTSVFGYDVIRSSQGFFPTFLVEVTESDVNQKIASLAAYKTYADKYYFSPELTKAILIRNGALCERKYAEGFDILRIVGEFAR